MKSRNLSLLVVKGLQFLVAIPFFASLIATSAWAGTIIIKGKETGN